MPSFDFNIVGTFHAPEGSLLLHPYTNLVQLPDGQVVSVHPVFELCSGQPVDDYHDLNYAEAQAVGLEMGDYDRCTYQVED